jgi:DNA-binding transcriptional MerR regulator
VEECWLPTLNSAVLRPVDVARATGYSVQQVRNLEHEGVLPLAARTASGYRIYTDVHLHSALAYRALAAGTGPVEAKRVMRAVHTRQADQALAHVDAAHARLDRERRDLALAKEAAAAISAELIGDERPSDAMRVSELASALGVRPSTLRHWDAEGLVVPDRLSAYGARRYSPAQVRDARIVHQLRSAGYRIALLQTLLPELRCGRRWRDVAAGLAALDAHIAGRSRALLDAAAALSVIVAPAAEH